MALYYDDDLEMHFDCYWEDLQKLARKHGERVADRDAWREPFDGDVLLEVANDKV